MPKKVPKYRTSLTVNMYSRQAYSLIRIMNRTHSLLLIAALAILGLRCGGKGTDRQKNDETREKASADSISHRIDRGKYLALNVAGCLYCHSHRDYKWFSGPTVSGTEAMGGQKFDKDFRGIPGIVYSRDITAAATRSWTVEKKSVV